MAGSSLLALLDDITTLLDDVATLTKVAAQKTTGVMGDDLALNAEQVVGLKANRELPVVWAVTKGSFVNKAILVPAALLISAFLPQAIVPLLMIGGAFLCYEGFEKIVHKLHAPDAAETEQRTTRVMALVNPAIDLVALEKSRIKGAIRTDFILSAEIVVIALGTMASEPIDRQIVALSILALGVTILVYGLVAGIVKLDDFGLNLSRSEGSNGTVALKRKLGRGILSAAPTLMKTLSIVGTAAMFIVGGSIIVHGVPPVEHLITSLSTPAATQHALLGTLVTTVLDAAAGVVVGGVIVGVVQLFNRVFAGKASSAQAH